MIIDATPHCDANHTAAWWTERARQSLISYGGAAPTTGPVHDLSHVSSDPMARGMALFHAGLIAEALPLIGQAALAGNARADYVLATALFNGDGVKRDWSVARWLMQRALHGGIVQAADSLAMMDALAPAEASPPVPESIPTLPALGDDLLSPAARYAAARSFSAIRVHIAPSPCQADRSLHAMVQALLLPMLREALEKALPQAVARQAERLIGQTIA